MDRLKNKMIDEKRENKERVVPIVFTWFEREDVTLARRITTKKLMDFLDQIKKLQTAMGVRMSLFLVTNTNKEVTLKRLTDLKKKSAASRTF